MKSAKRIGMILSLIVLCVTLMAVSAFAAKTIDSGTCGDNLTWTLDDAGTLTISGRGDMTSSPWRNNYQSVIKKVVISKGVTSVGDYAFYNCSGTMSITIPDSVTSIGRYAFWNCSSLTSVTIPKGVRSIGDSAFCFCSSLIGISVEKNNQNYCDINGILFNKKKTELIQAPGTLSGQYSIPEGVTIIDHHAFAECSNLSFVTISNGVISIGYFAFYNCCSLTSVTIPEGVTSIGHHAFWDCSSLTSVIIPSSALSIGDMAFSDCSSLTSVTIPEGVTSLGDYAFRNCGSLTSVTIPEGVTEIGCKVFYCCSSLTSVTIPEGVTSLGDYAFYNCSSLTAVTIPEGVTVIGYSAFSGCSSLNSVTIPKGVTSIEGGTFADCCSLTSVTIPEGVTSIGYEAFDGCSSLTDVYYTGSKADWAEIDIHDWGNEDLIDTTIHYNHVIKVATPEISKLENTASGVKITWKAVSRAEKYRVYIKNGSGWKNVGTTTGTSLTYTGVKSGTAYTFTVRCLSADGKTFTSGYNTKGWTQTYVAQPAISKLENTASGVKISWKSVSGAGQYRVYVKTSGGWSSVGTTTGTSLTWKGAKSGTKYTFTIRALDKSGKNYVSSYNTTGWKQTYVSQPSISKLENTASGVKISWKAVSGAGQYRVYVKTSSGWSSVGTTTGTSLTWKGAKSGTKYTFTIRALDKSGKNYVSSYNTTGWKQTYVAQPSISKLSNTSSGIKITWNKVSGAGMYRIFVKTSSGWTAIGTTSGTSLTWKGAKKGVKYTFTIRAMDKTGKTYLSSYNTTGWSIKRSK